MFLQPGETKMLSTKSSETSKQHERLVVGIVDCGRIGLLHACLFAEAGFRVICVDSDQATVERLLKGKVPFLKHEIEPVLQKSLASGRLKVTNDLKAVTSQGDILIVTTPVVISDKGEVDYSPLEKILKLIGPSLRKEMLVIITSIVGIGMMEGLFKEILESSSGFKAGSDFQLAYSPILFPERQTLKSLTSCRRIVAASDEASLEAALNVIKAVTNAGVIKTRDVKTAEAAVLFEAVFQNVNSALNNEFALFCEKLGIDYPAVRDLLSSAINMHTQPTSTNEAFRILLEEAENLNLKLRISETAMELNEEFLRHGVELIRDALKNCGKPLRRAKIALLGLSQTPNTADIPKDYVKKIISILEKKGAKLTLYDPYLSGRTLTDLEHTPIRKSLAEAVEGADCMVVLTGHDQLKKLNLRRLKLLAKMPAAIVDFESVLDPVEVEAEGFIYRGYGRGVWKR
ncbi:MAG: nucleotide sugar dehydrogenase [Candidatus Bathyarchaeia archaeon]